MARKARARVLGLGAAPRRRGLESGVRAWLRPRGGDAGLPSAWGGSPRRRRRGMASFWGAAAHGGARAAKGKALLCFGTTKADERLSGDRRAPDSSKDSIGGSLGIFVRLRDGYKNPFRWLGLRQPFAVSYATSRGSGRTPAPYMSGNRPPRVSSVERLISQTGKDLKLKVQDPNSQKAERNYPHSGKHGFCT